jgi:predicted HicB family RNase H-like nuclease
MAKTERLYIRLTPELKEKTQAAAEAEGRSISNYVERLITQALKREG